MKFNNEDYQYLISDLISQVSYSKSNNRTTIALIRTHAEVFVRKIFNIGKIHKVTLGDKETRKKIKELNIPLFEKAIDTIRDSGNNCTHTQYTKEVTDNEVKEASDALFNLYASLFVNYFIRHKFGINKEILSHFSLLPPIIRYIVLNYLYDTDPNNLDIIDKLTLAILKSQGKESALEWIEERKEELSSMMVYSEEAIDGIEKSYGHNTAEKIKRNAPKNMYTMCKSKIEKVSNTLENKGVAYKNFEQAKPHYLKIGKVSGNTPEIEEFNDIMEFVYIGRKSESSKEFDILSYLTIDPN